MTKYLLSFLVLASATPALADWQCSVTCISMSAYRVMSFSNTPSVGKAALPGDALNKAVTGCSNLNGGAYPDAAHAFTNPDTGNGQYSVEFPSLANSCVKL